MFPINRWINLHNIHAYLYFGFSQNDLNRQSKLIKYFCNRHVSIKRENDWHLKEENILFVIFFFLHETYFPYMKKMFCNIKAAGTGV